LLFRLRDTYKNRGRIFNRNFVPG